MSTGFTTEFIYVFLRSLYINRWEIRTSYGTQLSLVIHGLHTPNLSYKILIIKFSVHRDVRGGIFQKSTFFIDLIASIFLYPPHSRRQIRELPPTVDEKCLSFFSKNNLKITENHSRSYILFSEGFSAPYVFLLSKILLDFSGKTCRMCF